MQGSAAHEKRRSEVYRSIVTLDELTEKLKKDSFKISRSGVYLRLLPWRSSSLEATRRHRPCQVNSRSKRFAFKAPRRTILVYAAIEIQRNGLGKPEAIGYSGPTYIAIRSGKHCSSTAFAHGLDFGRLLSVPEFEKIMKSGPEKSVKPVIFLTVDGGPDDNPRYQNVIDVAVHHFLSHDLDGFFVPMLPVEAHSTVWKEKWPLLVVNYLVLYYHTIILERISITSVEPLTLI
ncbi:hypothetical protein DAPPUDRAFT_110834 [Daphnia pulex]|uniref:Uncharacterized protein n=1 Tax=Daphnia pulex TaxID=6669 RepID=E9H7A0_DAPPU|nr:hypothetical protein DAPPUDRAFT_110834 [Daphnia pulex]|eukprot:EFX72403.1 hypothetical protein DAPPUDRAFT_110834 [Daphnia pulex]